MTRTATGPGIAAAPGFAVSLGAQTTTTTTPQDQHSMRSDKGREVSVTGCLARGSDGAFTLTNARMDDRAGGSSATTTAGATNPTTTTAGTTGTTGSSSVGTTAAEPASPATTTGASGSSTTTWKLEGGKDLERHVGHKIEVTGRTDWNEHSSMSSSSSTTTTTGTTGSASASMTGGPRLDVSSVKMISASCQ